MYLYHLYRPDENKHKMKKACETGLTPELTSHFMGVGGAGDFYSNIIQRYIAESKTDNWIDFSKGIMVKFSPYNFEQYLAFPVFTDRIFIFDIRIRYHIRF